MYESVRVGLAFLRGKAGVNVVVNETCTSLHHCNATLRFRRSRLWICGPFICIFRTCDGREVCHSTLFHLYPGRFRGYRQLLDYVLTSDLARLRLAHNLKIVGYHGNLKIFTFLDYVLTYISVYFNVVQRS